MIFYVKGLFCKPLFYVKGSEVMSQFLTTGVDNFSAGQVGSTVITGLLIVFSVLAVIYVCLMIMERVFHRTKKTVKTVVSPLAGRVESVRNIARAAKDDAVLVIASDSGACVEVLCPEAGKLNVFVKSGDAVRSDERLFTIETEA